MKLFDYQQSSVDEILYKFKSNRKLLYCLATGGGKTFIFSFLTKHFIESINERVLILVDSETLLNQTIDSLRKIGVSCEAITQRVRKSKHMAKVYVAMIETSFNRLNKDPGFFKNVGLVIADECHILVYDKVFDKFPYSKILGCTATPVVNKNVNFLRCKYCESTYDKGTIEQCCGKTLEEWTKPFAMSLLYDDIVMGATVSELIEKGRLVPDFNIPDENYTDEGLELDNDTGEYTTDSMNKKYINDGQSFNVLEKYKEFGNGKKTIIFNATTEANKFFYDEFIKAGIENVFMYDSVNCKGIKKEDVVRKFKSTPGAVLLNVDVFTTGFDATDIEVVMLNRPVRSLSLYLQMVGRGGRTTDLIYKPRFYVIDGGGNLARHLNWSYDGRDWISIFKKGIGEERKKRQKQDITDVQMCENKQCNALFVKSLRLCPNCGMEVIVKKKQINKFRESNMIIVREVPKPDGESIYNYVKSVNGDSNLAHKILVNQIVDMFIYNKVERDLFEHSIITNEAQQKIAGMIVKPFYVLMSKLDIKAHNNRTRKEIYERIMSKLNKYYNI